MAAFQSLRLNATVSHQQLLSPSCNPPALSARTRGSVDALGLERDIRSASFSRGDGRGRKSLSVSARGSCSCLGTAKKTHSVSKTSHRHFRTREHRGESLTVRASDFDGGDDDIIEFDAEDADLDDMEIEELHDDADAEAALLESSLMYTSLRELDDAAFESAAAHQFPSELTVPGAPMAEGFEIDEEEFHRIPLYSCDFYVRKCPDVDDDVYDFSEMYVTAPASSSFSTPTVHGSMPSQPCRFTRTDWTYITGKTMPYSTDPNRPAAKEIHEVTKVFLTRHLQDERVSSPLFSLDFDEIYVLDGHERSIKRANVQREVPAGDRDRQNELLIVRDDGNTFRIIPKEEQRHADEVIQEFWWHQSKESVETYLRGFRDFDKSNWF